MFVSIEIKTKHNLIPDKEDSRKKGFPVSSQGLGLFFWMLFSTTGSVHISEICICKGAFFSGGGGLPRVFGRVKNTHNDAHDSGALMLNEGRPNIFARGAIYSGTIQGKNSLGRAGL